MNNRENNGVNAKNIAKNVFLGVKELVFIPGKSAHLSRLGALFLVISEGSWELDTCHHLIGGLNGALS